MSRRTGKPSYQLSVPDTRRGRLVRVAVVVAVIGLVGVLVGGVAGYTAGQPDGVDAAIADIRKAEAQRDSQQIVELTATARRLREEISPVLSALGADAPISGQPGPEQARQWRQTMLRAAEPFANPPSGTTATNVARGGLRSAVEQASLAVESYFLAVTGPPTQRAALTELAKRQAVQAAAAWSVAATQLDQVNIDAGQGHQHVYLDAGPGGGALAPDGATEGSGG
ncbi:hypothetical protein GA0070216_13221 [Micromonospora matsumotoense]|uniref:Uncharacterized protein n=1 Tax=Micromonospora matsumotoense TaxID=121616 RepID=A0A1C5AVR9_9ACTN|nr:hypothetical protein [Micromonospora matsumotoense]SCF49141.1 hypothetical protein GA0070216_13221 [Micromonospora matsumotoense]